MEKAVLYIMAYLAPIVGIGQIYGNTIMRGSNQYIEDIAIEAQFSIEIQFYSITGEFVDSVGTSYDKAPSLKLDLKERKNGGLESFDFELSRNIDIPFNNQMEIRVFVFGNHWFSGELLYNPDQDTRNVKFKYEGKGYSHYFKDITVNELYENKTLKYIIEDLLDTYIVDDTPIRIDSDRINPPDITVTKLELNDKKVSKALDRVLEIANSTGDQYKYLVDKDKIFEFSIILEINQDAFFEGTDYQNPKVKSNNNDIVNLIEIYRSKEGTDEVEYVSTIQDLESQGKYGIKSEPLTIPDFLDTTTAERIAQAKIDQKKDPLKTIVIDNLNVNLNPFDIGYYLINNKFDSYVKLINECEELDDWTLNISDTTVTEDTDKVFSGRKAFKCVTGSGSKYEYLEYELEEELYFPDKFILYIAQDTTGEMFNIQVFDVDGNNLFLTEAFLLQENGDPLLQENGDPILLEGLYGINVTVLNDYHKIEVDISALENVKKVRIVFVTNEGFTGYIDRIEFSTNSYFQNRLLLDEIIYSLDSSSFLAKATFGEKIFNIIDDIKKIKDDTNNIFNIFEKS
jgi:hypothetical protein